MKNNHVLANAHSIREGLKQVGYFANEETAIAIRNAYILKKPLFLEGPPGVGKTQLAKSLQKMLQSNWFRLQCTPEMTERKALYEMDYQKQLLHIQLYKGNEKVEAPGERHFFSREYLIERPLLQALQQDSPSVLLVDELDKASEEFEYSLLEIFGEYTVTIPELKETIAAKEIPFTIITSNNTRPVSDTILRRCVYLHIDYPSLEDETVIIQTVADVNEELSKAIASTIRLIREAKDLKLKQKPSTSEGIEWAKVISFHLTFNEEKGMDSSVKEEMLQNLSVLAKTKEDQKKMSDKIKAAVS